MRKPLGYKIVRQSGSHRRLESQSGYPPLTFSFHDRATVPRGAVRKVLCEDVGLAENAALGLL
jgi:predicted RNA binding protein YcfA (HicA-like mRNA interferase family)